MSRCRSCAAEITWVKTTAGKMIPLDVEPVDQGNIVLVDGRAVVTGQATLLGDEGPRYVAHFVTCPDADEHRSKGST